MTAVDCAVVVVGGDAVGCVLLTFEVDVANFS